MLFAGMTYAFLRINGTKRDSPQGGI